MGEPAHDTLLVTWRGSIASEIAGLKRVVAALQLPGSVSVFTESEHKAEARRVRAVPGAGVSAEKLNGAAKPSGGLEPVGWCGA